LIISNSKVIMYFCMKGEMKRKDILIRIAPKNSTNKKAEDISPNN